MPPDRPIPMDAELAALRDAQVPLVSLLEACRNCDDPCEENGSNGINSSSSSIFDTLDVDLDSNLLGSVKTNGRTVLVATGKSDWVHSVTDEEGLYAHTIAKAYETHLKILPPPPTEAAASSASGSRSRCVKGIEGLEDSWTDGSATERKRNMTILCSNLRKYEPYGSDVSEEEGTETVMIFPDYKLVANCPSTSADELVASHLSPLHTSRLSRAFPGSGGCSTSASRTIPRAFTLPYYAVILVCSHKRRDKRCSITADPLIDALRSAIEHQGGAWHVDTHGNDEELLSRCELAQIETGHVAMEGQEARVDAELRKLSSTETRADANIDKHVGIFKVSHVGGHRYSGQVMLWFPNGVNVWYGRVRDGDCKAIVHETLLGGRVIPELLRGGTGLGGRGKSVLAW